MCCCVLIVNGNSFSLKLNDQGVDAKAGSANAMRKSNQSKSFPRLYFCSCKVNFVMGKTDWAWEMRRGEGTYREPGDVPGDMPGDVPRKSKKPCGRERETFVWERETSVRARERNPFGGDGEREIPSGERERESNPLRGEGERERHPLRGREREESATP